MVPSHHINKSLNVLVETSQLTVVCFALHRCPMCQQKTLTKWSRNSRSGKRSGNRSAGGASSTKTRILTRSTTGMSTSTRRLSAPLASTRSRSRTTSKEVLPYRTKTIHNSYLLAFFKLTTRLEASVPAVVFLFAWLLCMLVT